MKKVLRIILDYAQIIIAFFVLQYLRIRGLDTNNINDLGLILALPTTMAIVAGFLNRISDDWAGFTVVAIMIYTLIIMLKMKYFMIGIPASLGLICLFYFPSGMNMERLKANREKAKDKEKDKL
ncbi:MAG: hypothetical protein IJS60_09250 [Abditibacteriota bacterium]|nr:hypothetical protein [Abditibacteriota bacterium]